MKRLLVAAVLLASACSGGPSAPSTPPASFAGAFNGTYSVTSCTETGQFTGWCIASGLTGNLPIAVSLSQTQNSVSGPLVLGSTNGNFQGTANGSSLNGAAAMNNLNVAGITAIPNVTAWSSTLSGNNMTGSFTLTYAATGLPGGVTVNARIVQLSR